MPSVLEKTIATVSAMQTEAAKQYAKLVVDLAADKDIPAEDVMAIVADSDHTLAELEGDVHRRIERVNAAAALAAMPTAQAEMSKAQRVVKAIEKEQAEALARLEAEHAARRTKAEAEFAAKLADAARVVDRHVAAIAAANEGRALLMVTGEPELKSRLAQLERERAVSVAEIERFKPLAGEQARIIAATVVPVARDETKSPRLGFELEISRARQDEAISIRRAQAVVDGARRRHDDYRARIDGHEARIAEIEAEAAKLETQLLIP